MPNSTDELATDFDATATDGGHFIAALLRLAPSGPSPEFLAKKAEIAARRAAKAGA